MDIQKSNMQLFVALGSQIDLFRFPQISTNAQIAELNKPKGFIYYQVEDLETASDLCKNFIKEFSLGSSNWIGGRVIDEHSNFIARISYNGRIWDNEDWKKAKEII